MSHGRLRLLYKHPIQNRWRDVPTMLAPPVHRNAPTCSMKTNQSWTPEWWQAGIQLLRTNQNTAIKTCFFKPWQCWNKNPNFLWLKMDDYKHAHIGGRKNLRGWRRKKQGKQQQKNIKSSWLSSAARICSSLCPGGTKATILPHHTSCLTHNESSVIPSCPVHQWVNLPLSTSAPRTHSSPSTIVKLTHSQRLVKLTCSQVLS